MIGLLSPRQAEQQFFVQYLLMFYLQYDTLLDPREFVANILASRDIYHEKGQIAYNDTFMDDHNFYCLRKALFS